MKIALHLATLLTRCIVTAAPEEWVVHSSSAVESGGTTDVYLVAERPLSEVVTVVLVGDLVVS